MPFRDSLSSSSNLFDLIHDDIQGPYKVPSITGAHYFLTVVEEPWTYLLDNKGVARDFLIIFLTIAKFSLRDNGKTIEKI